MSHLGMNGYDEVYITEDVVKDLEEEIKSIFLVRSHLTDFFGVSNFKKNLSKNTNRKT